MQYNFLSFFKTIAKNVAVDAGNKKTNFAWHYEYPIIILFSHSSQIRGGLRLGLGLGLGLGSLSLSQT